MSEIRNQWTVKNKSGEPCCGRSLHLSAPEKQKGMGLVPMPLAVFDYFSIVR
jgi:hypothetical protein